MSDPDVIRLPRGRIVPPEAVVVRADTAGGPGGQHANRSATRVEVRIDVAALPLSEQERERLERRLVSRLTSDSVLAVREGGMRSQLRNRRAAIERAERILADALAEQPARVPTREPRAARLRRQMAKMHRSRRKRDRRWRPGDD